MLTQTTIFNRNLMINPIRVLVATQKIISVYEMGKDEKPKSLRNVKIQGSKWQIAKPLLMLHWSVVSEGFLSAATDTVSPFMNLKL